jgi:hypothetical protein
MEKKQYKLPKRYFKESNYAVELSKELDNDADGLIFDRYFHDIGMQLHIDVLFEKINKDGDTWFLGGNRHVQMVLQEHTDHYLLSLTPLDEQGDSIIQTLNLENIM